ncbi:MAG: nucleotidyl transferase AbiEii/AbiGii toxin family protein [Firmicutes bacterium]|nr:nucleotidyl transferase AbiEii/AbiGii toxin family protein [Bacillota bacterium]
MFEDIMSAERHSFLEQLTQLGLLKDFYLAGGTAAALYLGHRWSEGLDFLTGHKFDSFQLAKKLAQYVTF